MNYFEFKKTTHIGSFVDMILAILKLFVGTYIQSQALIADGIHSFSDLLSNILILIFGKIANEAPDKKHPYGHGRFETLGTIILGVFIVLTGGILAWETLQNLFEKNKNIYNANHQVIIIIIACISFISKEILFRWTKKIGIRLQSAMMVANAYHARSDAYSSLVVALSGILGYFKFSSADSITSFIISFMITKMGIDIIIPAAKEIVDTLPDEKKVEQINHIIKNTQGVRGLHNLRARNVGNEVMVDVNIEVHSFISVSEGHEIAATVAKKVVHNIEEINDIIVHIDVCLDKIKYDNYEAPTRDEIWNILHNHQETKEYLKDNKQLIIHYDIQKKSIKLEIFLYTNVDLNWCNLIEENLKEFYWFSQITFWHKAKGQTIVEYVILVAVMASLSIAIMGKLKDWLIGRSDCPNNSFICRVQDSMLGEGYLNGNYRYFKLQR